MTITDAINETRRNCIEIYRLCMQAGRPELAPIYVHNRKTPAAVKEALAEIAELELATAPTMAVQAAPQPPSRGSFDSAALDGAWAARMQRMHPQS